MPRNLFRITVCLICLCVITAAACMMIPKPAPAPRVERPAGSVLVRETKRTALTAAIVFDRIRSCAELVTVHVECGPWEERLRQETSIRFWPDATETISALVCGRISYGLDLSQLKNTDVTIGAGGHTVKIRLPPVRKLGSRIDIERTRIVDHHRSWFWPRDSTLREAVLQQAEARLKSTDAPHAKLMAKKKAEELVERLVRQVGGLEVVVEFVEEDAECAEPKSGRGAWLW